MLRRKSPLSYSAPSTVVKGIASAGMKLRRRISAGFSFRSRAAASTIRSTQIGGLGTAGAAIGIDRHRVGEDALHLEQHGRERVDGGVHLGAGERRDERRVVRQIGAEIGHCGYAQAEKLAVGRQRQLRRRDMVAALCVARECLVALGDPLHRTPDLLGRPDDERLLGIEEDLHAEPAADITRHHAHAIVRNLEDVASASCDCRPCTPWLDV